jgi:hypothetical protein
MEWSKARDWKYTSKRIKTKTELSNSNNPGTK